MIATRASPLEPACPTAPPTLTARRAAVCHGPHGLLRSLPSLPHLPRPCGQGPQTQPTRPALPPALQSSLPLFLGLAAAGGGLYYAKEQVGAMLMLCTPLLLDLVV